MKNKWINVTKRENWFASKYSVMCSKHFTEDCFSKYLFLSFLMTSNKRRLMSAVPTLFLPRTMDTPNEVASNLIQEMHQKLLQTHLKTFSQRNLLHQNRIEEETSSQFNSSVKKDYADRF